MAPKREGVLARASQAERREARRRAGSLDDFLVAPATRRRYTRAVAGYRSYCLAADGALPRSPEATDAAAARYISYLWENGDPRTLAGDVISGLTLFAPAVKGRLRGSWRLLKAWGKAELPARAPPFTAVLVYGLAERARQKGWQDTMVAMLLAWHTWARPGEVFAAKCGHFAFTDALHAAWRLPATKSGARTGTEEALVIADPWLGRLLKAWAARRGPEACLVDAPQQEHRRRLKVLCEEAQLDAGFRWYSFRRGGATHFFGETSNLGACLVRGRWADARTARIYLTEGLAKLSETAPSPHALAQLRAQARRLRRDFNTAPQ